MARVLPRQISWCVCKVINQMYTELLLQAMGGIIEHELAECATFFFFFTRMRNSGFRIPC